MNLSTADGSWVQLAALVVAGWLGLVGRGEGGASLPIVARTPHFPLCIAAIIEHVRDGSVVRALLLPDYYLVTVMLSGIKVRLWLRVPLELGVLVCCGGIPLLLC